MITSGALGAGSRLPIEKYLAGELGVSRRSLREGCAPWCIMGVLEARQGEVTYVTSLEPSLLLVPMSFMADLHAASDNSHLRSVRRVLETEAAGSAALTIDKDALAEAEAILTSVEPLVNSLAETDYEAIMVADIAFHRVSTAPPGMIGRPISWARRMTALEKPWNQEPSAGLRSGVDLVGMDDDARPDEHARILGHGGNGLHCCNGAEGDLRDRQSTGIQRLGERNGIGWVVHDDDRDDAPPGDLGQRGHAGLRVAVIGPASRRQREARCR